MLVGNVDRARGFQPGEIFARIDLADLMAPMGNVAAELFLQDARIAAGVAGPAREGAREVDVDHDAAEIEQQGIGGPHGHVLFLAGR